jgi:hypothetical protein
VAAQRRVHRRWRAARLEQEPSPRAGQQPVAHEFGGERADVPLVREHERRGREHRSGLLDGGVEHAFGDAITVSVVRDMRR